jgi:plastocyanin
VATSGFASAALVACSGDAVKDNIEPTRIANVEGAPPTLAPNATPFSSEQPAGGAAAAPAGGGGGPITVTGLDSLKFDPAKITAAPGQVIHFVNGGVLQHDLNIDELNMKMEPIDGGAEKDLTIPADAKPGDYTYYCSVPGHREAGMEGTLTVVEAGAAGGGGQAAATEEATPAEAATPEQAAGAGGGGAPAGPIEVHTLDALQFDPSTIDAAPGQEIHVINDGVMQHDFIIDELNMATDLLNNGQEQTVTVPADAQVGQSYTYYCSVPGHRQAGMEGTLTIVEAGAGAAATTTEGTPAEATQEAAAAPSGPVDASKPVDVETLDSLQFNPSQITVAPGQTIRVTNNGSLQHDFVIDEWGLATALLSNSQTDEITVPADAQAGQSYTYYCSVPGHAAAGMQGTLTVAEAAGGAAATQAPAEGTPAAKATPPAQATPGVTLAPDAIRVATLDSMRFAPSQFSAAPGQQIYLVNPGVLVHDIVVDEWKLDSGPLAGGESTTFNIPKDAEVGSEVEFYCSVPGHRESGMVGKITIIEADVAQEEAVTPLPGASPVGEATPAQAATPAATEAAASPAAASAGGGAIEVHTLDQLKFDPDKITASPGEEITVTNEGVMQHDFIIDELDMATDLLNNGQSQTVKVPDDAKPGDYTYYCSVPGHQASGMEGTLTVK